MRLSSKAGDFKKALRLFFDELLGRPPESVPEPELGSQLASLSKAIGEKTVRPAETRAEEYEIPHLWKP